MRLADLLSKAPSSEEAQVEGFLTGQSVPSGKHRTIEVGKIFLTLNCKACDQDRPFQSRDKLSCLVVSERVASIDTCLRCASCKAPFEAWFLVVARDSIFSSAPTVWLDRYVESRRGVADRVRGDLGPFEELFDRSQRAYAEGLGAGAMIYLRKAFETITSQAAGTSGISSENKNPGKKKSFYALLKDVDEAHQIIPAPFSGNGYQLFRELSDVIHGDTSEDVALSKYEPCRKLVMGIVNNVFANAEMRRAIDTLGWEAGEPISSKGDAS